MSNAKKLAEQQAAETEIVKREASHVERIRQAVSLEIRACTDRAVQVVEDVRRKVQQPPPLKLVKVPR